MKNSISIATLSAAVLINGFVPLYIIEKYTQCTSEGVFLLSFASATPSDNNRAATQEAQEAFVETMGGCRFIEG